MRERLDLQTQNSQRGSFQAALEQLLVFHVHIWLKPTLQAKQGSGSVSILDVNIGVEE